MRRETFFDRDVSLSERFVARTNRRYLQKSAWLLSRTGDAWFWAIWLFIIFWLERQVGFVLAVGVGAVAVVIHLLKGVFKRPRPFEHGRELANDKYSFPSGHAARMGTAATILTLAWPQWSWLFILWAVLVALSRVVQSRHYLGDVLAGLALGLIVGLGTQIILGFFTL